MTIKGLILRFLGADNVNRTAERRIKKSIELYHKGGRLSRIRALRLFNKNLRDYCCYIAPQATFGKNVYIAHPMGIQIGPTTVIGDNCLIYPNVFIGAKIVGDMELRASGEKRRHAKIGNNCMLGAGCMILGNVEIGDNVIVAARSMVTKNVPSNSIVKNINEISQRGTKESIGTNGRVIVI